MGSSLTISQNTRDEEIEFFSSEEPWKAVFAKVEKSAIFQQKLSSNVDKMIMFAKQISDPEELKKTYLNTSWSDSVKLYKEKMDDDDIWKKQTKHDQFKSKDDGGDWSTEKQIDDNTLNTLKEQDQFVQDIKIKLVISEIVNTPAKRAIRQLVSPFLDQMNVLPDLGLFHSGIIIGPWKLDWNDSSIVVPKKIIAGAAVMTADLDHIHTLKKLEETVDKIAHVICKWNVQKMYRDSGGDKRVYGNCQDFNDDLLHALGLKLDFSGPLKNYMDNLRSKGKCDMEFTIEPNFRETFGIQQRSITFKSHEQLDKFVEGLLAKEPSFETKYKSEWVLLKNFDRALWLKFQKFDTKEYIPHYKDEHRHTLLCPFGDPATTMSMMGLERK